MVFARGRLEPPGVGILGNAFISALRSKTNKNIGIYAVRYPADTEIDVGANDMSAHIQYMTNNCPDTRLVLGGYSLGAAVTDVVLAVPFDFFGFTNPLPPGADQHIAAVALFGNGSAWVGPITNFNPLYSDRTIELCHGADPICNPADPEHLGRQLARTTSPTRTSRQAWRTRPPISSRARSNPTHPQITGDLRARLELVIGRVVHADERQAVRRRGGEVAGPLRRRQQRGAPTGFAAVLADRQQRSDQ